MDRKAFVRQHLNLNGLGLELGPSHDPIAPKREGYNVHIVDHLPQEALREKYRGHGVSLERIEPVDFVWQGQPLPELLDGKVYDWIIASHVIEHVPDLAGFVRQCQAVLKPGGIIALAIPDKRYCFDYYRPVSSSGSIMQAHLEKRTRHVPGQIYDSFSMACVVNGTISWSKTADGSPKFLHSEGFGRAMLENYLSDGEYVDIHAWVFTPSSFRLAIHDLHDVGMLDVEIDRFHETVGCEFFVFLKNVPRSRPEDRLALVRAVIAEEALAAR